MGLLKPLERCEDRFRRVNQLVGDIPQSEPSSKMVGGLRRLPGEERPARSARHVRRTSLPARQAAGTSAVARLPLQRHRLFQGHLGNRPVGSETFGAILKGQPALTAGQRRASCRRSREAGFGPVEEARPADSPGTRRSALLYPRVLDDYWVTTVRGRFILDSPSISTA